MVFVEGDDYRALRRPGDGPAQFRSLVRLPRISVPDSVEHQYRAENFTQTVWPDTAGNADMLINGPVQGTISGEPSVSSDGVDDSATSSGPETVVTQTEYGVAFTLNSIDTTDLSVFLGANGSDGAFNLNDSDFNDGSTGDLKLKIDDNSGSDIDVESTQVVCDGVTHLICVNKRGDSGSQVEFYIDDMTTQATTTVHNNDTGFDSQNYTISADMGFFSLNNQGTTVNFKSLDFGLIEFNSEPYTQTERENIIGRRPEVY
jgi:hypothetical protein